MINSHPLCRRAARNEARRISGVLPRYPFDFPELWDHSVMVGRSLSSRGVEFLGIDGNRVINLRSLD